MEFETREKESGLGSQSTSISHTMSEKEIPVPHRQKKTKTELLSFVILVSILLIVADFSALMQSAHFGVILHYLFSVRTPQGNFRNFLGIQAMPRSLELIAIWRQHSPWILSHNALFRCMTCGSLWTSPSDNGVLVISTTLVLLWGNHHHEDCLSTSRCWTFPKLTLMENTTGYQKSSESDKVRLFLGQWFTLVKSTSMENQAKVYVTQMSSASCNFWSLS